MVWKFTKWYFIICFVILLLIIGVVGVSSFFAHKQISPKLDQAKQASSVKQENIKSN